MTARRTAAGRIESARLWTIPLLLAVCGCAYQGQARPNARPTVRPGEFGTPGCFYREQVRNFEVLDDSNLLVFAPGKSDAYHVHISPPSWSLRSSETIGFESRTSQVCGYAGERLLQRNSTGNERGWINGVYRLQPPELTALRTRFGLEKSAKQAAPPPAEAPEVERELGNPDPN